MHNLKKFNMNRKYRVRIRCLTFLVTLFWLPLHAQEAGKEFRPAGEPISYAEKDNRKKSPEPLEDQKDKLKKQRIITAKGRVTDAAGEPLIGVNVLIKESGTGQVTDLNGEFKLPDIRFGSPLRISFIGYKTLEVNARENMRLTLYEDRTKLDEVVIVGYGSQKKANLSGAVSSVSIDALAERPVTNAENALAGLASGLTVTNSGGNTPGFETSTIRIRGVGTLNNADPLVVIDGVAGCAISDINPQDIKNISILKDAASSAIYGSRAANGVILITTKTGYEGSAKITYSGNFSFEKVAKRLNLVTDYADFMEIQNAALSANGQAPRFSQTSIDAWRNDNGANPTVYPNTDWQDHIYRNPSVVQNQPEGQGRHLHLRGHRPEALDRGEPRPEPDRGRGHGLHHRCVGHGVRTVAAAVYRPLLRLCHGRILHVQGQARPHHLRRPVQARGGLPCPLAADPPSAGT